MGYGELGGGGSVHWLIDADDVDETVEKGDMFGSRRRHNRREWRQHGVDYHGKKEDAIGTDFTVRIKLPDSRQKREEWLDAMRRKLAAADDVLEFTLPIENSGDPHTQIQVCWGNAPRWEDNLYRLSQELRGRGNSK